MNHLSSIPSYETSSVQSPFEADLAVLIVTSLQLEMDAGDIAPREPLFNEGLGLDSIDALELSLALSREFGVELKSDHADIKAIFANLRNLARHVETQRTR